jgi:hypothetical protein
MSDLRQQIEGFVRTEEMQMCMKEDEQEKREEMGENLKRLVFCHEEAL